MRVPEGILGAATAEKNARKIHLTFCCAPINSEATGYKHGCRPKNTEMNVEKGSHVF
jgi:hypothetical protein